MGYGYYPRYVSVAEKKAKAEKKIKQLRRKKPDIKPVMIQGQALATTWWGKSWNRNLERYADYSNRIGRGRSYVRHMAVLDLQIKPGLVEALVQGTRAAPYKVRIKISKINKKNWQQVKEKCQAELSSLPDLLAGKFPRKLQDIFMVQGGGLFPTPAEISFDCSCPDWASMCKHVAATLYGVGARLDEDPALFFTLRKVEMEELVAQAVQDKTDTIIAKQASAKGRVIADDQLSELFGIDLEDFTPRPPAKSAKRGQKSTPVQKKSPAGSRKAENKKTVNKGQARKQRGSAHGSKLPAGYGSATNLVLGCVEESGAEGISVKDLADITAIPRAKLYSILHTLKKTDRVTSPSRGIYLTPPA